jgi:hypothetical protein
MAVTANSVKIEARWTAERGSRERLRRITMLVTRNREPGSGLSSFGILLIDLINRIEPTLLGQSPGRGRTLTRPLDPAEDEPPVFYSTLTHGPASTVYNSFSVA